MKEIGTKVDDVRGETNFLSFLFALHVFMLKFGQSTFNIGLKCGKDIMNFHVLCVIP